MRIVLTVTVPADPAQAAEVLRGIVPDLESAADSIATEMGPELKPGQYGYTMNEKYDIRLHWGVRDDQGKGYEP